MRFSPPQGTLEGCARTVLSRTIAGMNVEEALREIHSRAAMLRYLLDLASISDEHPAPAGLAGAGAVAGDVERLTRSVMEALNRNVQALGAELPAPALPARTMGPTRARRNR